MLYSALLVSAIQQRESVISIDPSVLNLPSPAPVSPLLVIRISFILLNFLYAIFGSHNSIKYPYAKVSVVAQKWLDAHGCCY